MASDDEDEELMALRSAVLASMKQKVNKENQPAETVVSETEDPELAALREAALKSKRAPGSSDVAVQPEKPLPRKVVQPQPGNVHQKPGKFGKFPGPGMGKQRGNLITIQTVPMETENPPHLKQQMTKKPEFTLLRPQDRWASSGGGSDSDKAGLNKTKGSDKFSRFESSESESEDSLSEKSDHEEEDLPDKSDSDIEGHSEKDFSGPDSDHNSQRDSSNNSDAEDEEPKTNKEIASDVENDLNSVDGGVEKKVSEEMDTEHKDTYKESVTENEIKKPENDVSATAKSLDDGASELPETESKRKSPDVNETKESGESESSSRSSETSDSSDSESSDSELSSDSDQSSDSSDSSKSDTRVKKSSRSSSRSSESRQEKKATDNITRSPQHVNSAASTNTDTTVHRKHKRSSSREPGVLKTLKNRDRVSVKEPRGRGPVKERESRTQKRDQNRNSSQNRNYSQNRNSSEDHRSPLRRHRSHSGERNRSRSPKNSKNYSPAKRRSYSPGQPRYDSRDSRQIPVGQRNIDKRDYSRMSYKYSPDVGDTLSVSSPGHTNSRSPECRSIVQSRSGLAKDSIQVRLSNIAGGSKERNSDRESRNKDKSDLTTRAESSNISSSESKEASDKLEARRRKFASTQEVQLEGSVKISLKDIKISHRKHKKTTDRDSSKTPKKSSSKMHSIQRSSSSTSNRNRSSRPKKEILSDSKNKSNAKGKVNAVDDETTDGKSALDVGGARQNLGEERVDSAGAGSSSSDSNMSSLSDMESESDGEGASWRFTHTGKIDPSDPNGGQVAYERGSHDIERERRQRQKKRQEERKDRPSRRQRGEDIERTSSSRHRERASERSRNHQSRPQHDRPAYSKQWESSSSSDDDSPVRKSLVSVVKSDSTKNQERAKKHKSRPPNKIWSKHDSDIKHSSDDKRPDSNENREESSVCRDKKSAAVAVKQPLSPPQQDKPPDEPPDEKTPRSPSRDPDIKPKSQTSSKEVNRIVISKSESKRHKSDARHVISSIKKRKLDSESELSDMPDTVTNQRVSITFDKGFDVTQPSSRLPVHKRLGHQVITTEGSKTKAHAQGREKKSIRRVICGESTERREKDTDRTPPRVEKSADDAPQKRISAVEDTAHPSSKKHKKIKIVRHGSALSGGTKEIQANDGVSKASKDDPSEQDLDEKIRKIKEQNAAILRRKEEIEREKKQFGY